MKKPQTDLWDPRSLICVLSRQYDPNQRAILIEVGGRILDPRCAIAALTAYFKGWELKRHEPDEQYLRLEDYLESMAEAGG